MLSTTKERKESPLKFGIGKDLNSINKKLILKLDTVSDGNAINWKEKGPKLSKKNSHFPQYKLI